MAVSARSNDLRPGEIIVEDVWERFRMYQRRPPGIKDRILRMERSAYKDFWALKGVSLSLEPGDSLAIIGENGSGKSTLLKCLARILPIDRGSLRIGGKVASLLELGAGFHSELTGRENVYLNGSILGLSRKEINRLFDEIVEFAGVEEFIDAPVRNYSSGMYVRLGFAIAINVDPDVLLVDEILAVGDQAFQTKCFEKMHDFKRRDKTMILVTHDLDTAARLCDRAILIEHGAVVSDGIAREVVNNYRQRVSEDAPGTADPRQPTKRWGTGEAEILDVMITNGAGEPIERLSVDATFTFQVRVRFKEHIENPIFGVILRADDGTELFVTNTMWRGTSTGSFRGDTVTEVRFRLEAPLLPGRYVVTTAVAHQDGTQWYDWWNDCLFFHIQGQTSDHGYVNMRPQIEWHNVQADFDVKGATRKL